MADVIYLSGWFLSVGNPLCLFNTVSSISVLLKSMFLWKHDWTKQRAQIVYTSLYGIHNK